MSKSSWAHAQFATIPEFAANCGTVRLSDEWEADLDDQKILAAIDNFGAVTVCPGGIVHINMPHFTIKLMPSDFVKFTELIEAARRSYSSPAPKPAGKPRLQVVSPQCDQCDGSTEDDSK